MCPVQAHPVADDGAWCPPEWQGDSGIRRMGLWAPEDATWLQALQGRYQQWRQSKMTLSPDATIPRVLHHIWLGPAPIPARFEEFMARWRTLHPESRGEYVRYNLPSQGMEQAGATSCGATLMSQRSDCVNRT